MPETKHPLKVFLCHASQDKPVVRELSRRLIAEGWIDAWLDEKKLLPGQDWRTKIEEAVETSDIVIICLSSNSVSKEGFVQKELRYAKEIALEKPEETIFLIPLRLDDCETPRGLRFFQWADYFGEKREETYNALLQSLNLRYEQKLRHEAEERARQEKAKAEREAAEQVAKQKARQEYEEKIAREKVEHEAAEKIAREKREREAAEKAAREKVEREAAEKANREKVEREAAEKLALENAEREKAEREVDKEIEGNRLSNDAADTAEVDGDEPETVTPERKALHKTARNGADSFYLIAGVSLVATFFGVLTGGPRDWTGFLIPLLPAVGYAVCGYLARKRYHWSFFTGFTLYTLDAIGIARAEQWLALVFHIVWLVLILMGWAATRKLTELDRSESKVGWMPKYPILPKLALVFAFSEISQPVAKFQNNTPLPLVTADAGEMNVKQTDLDGTFTLQKEAGEEYINLSISDANERTFLSDQIILKSAVFVNQSYWDSSDPSTTATFMDFVRNSLPGDNVVFESTTNVSVGDSGKLQVFSDTTKGWDGYVLYFTSKNVLVRIILVGTPSAVKTFDIQALAEIVAKRIP
jgi:hypothetical protein